MKKILVVAIVAGVMWISSPEVGAVNYYVDATGGNNTSDGRSDATAWQTIGKVNSYAFQTGDDVYLKCGETWTPYDALQVDWQTSAASESNRAVIGAYFMDGGTEVIVDETNYQGHTKPILQGSYDPYTWPDPVGVPTSPYKGLLYAYNGNDYVTFQDIHVKDSNGDGVRYYRCNYGRVTRVKVEVCNMSGIRYVQCHRYTPTGDLGGERLAIIEYCEVSGNDQNYAIRGNNGVSLGSVGGRHAWIHHNIMHEGYGEALGVYNNTSLQNQGWATVEDNTIYDIRKGGIYIASAGNTIVRRNLIYHTGNSTYYLTYANGRYWGPNGLGICNEEGGGHLNYQCNDIYLYDNLVTGCYIGLGFGSQWPEGQDVVSNIKYFNNTLVANCKTVSVGSSLARSAIELGSGNEVKNNTFWLYDPDIEDSIFSGYAPYTGITFDNNLWSSDPENDRVKGPNDPYYALPLLTRTSGWHNVAVGKITPDDFALQCCSPAIEAGTDVGLTHDFEWNPVPHGLAPDIGAFEFTGIACLPIDQNGWGLVYVDSEEMGDVDRPATNSFDGDPDTFWHTEWSLTDPDPAHPHEIQIDLGGFYDICGFRYLPRQDDSENGMIDEYKFYVSNDSSNWGTAVAGGTLTKDKTEKQVSFDRALGQYVRLVALSEVNGNPWTSIAELNVLAVQPDSDINDDGKINLEDFAVLATWWDDENACALPDWCEDSDFDMSGTIDFFDLAYFVENWLR